MIKIILIWNFAVFLLYGIDKRKAVKSSWRIPEKTLLLAGFFLGGIGAITGMYVFHHKTKHRAFQIIVPITAVLTVLAIVKIYLNQSSLI